MTIQERLTFGQTYVVQSDGPIKITQAGAHGTLVKVDITDAAGTAGREVVFTAIDTAAEVEVDAGTNWSCVPGFNRGAASVQGSAAELPAEQVAFLQAVTDGKLTFDADGRLQIATSVDAAGTFNHDGYASNYTKTVDGVKYTTTVSANEVKVVKRVGGVDTTVMHLANGELALNGYAVVTEKGSTVEFLPDNPNYAMKQGATVQLTEYTDTLELLPSTLTTAQEMRVLYSPAEARTTPLIAVPQGVTLHWAGDEEPTWEAGNDYVIQLLQTAPTHIEARLFNAPQGAKLPDWLKAPYVVYKNLVAVAADFEGQTDGYRQFASDQASVKALAQELDKATFAEQLRGDGQFNGAIDTYLSLRNATFNKETTANEQFSNGAQKERTIYAPRATFGAVEVAGTFVGYMANCYFPSATFKSLVSIEYFASASRGNHMFPSATFEKVESVNRLLMACIPFCYFYSLNFRKLSSVPNFVNSVLSTGAFNDRHREMFLSLVYGPRLDAEGNPTPVTKIDPATGDPTALEPAELTGARRTDQSERPTGWGIQDFRVLNEDGTFARDSEGNYVYPDDVHNFKVPFYATARPVAEGGRAAYGEDIAQALSDLGERGWAVAYF